MCETKRRPSGNLHSVSVLLCGYSPMYIQVSNKPTKKHLLKGVNKKAQNDKLIVGSIEVNSILFSNKINTQ